MKKAITIILAVVFLFAFASTANAQITKDQYYARSTLSGNELEFYDYVYDTNLEGIATVYPSDFGVGNDRGYSIIQFVGSDAPELFRRVDYSDSEAVELQKKIDLETKNALRFIEDDMSDYEKVETLYNYLGFNIEFDYGADSDIKNSVDSRQANEAQTIVGGLVNHKAVCAGIAKSLQYLLYQIDIPCYEVTGTFNDEPHGWNLIQVDGEWYYADLTMDIGNGVFERGEANQFLRSDRYMTDHYASKSDNPPLPECTSDKYMETEVRVAIEPTETPTVEATPEPDMAAEVTGEPTSEAAEAREAGPGDILWYILGGAAVVAAIRIIWVVMRKKKQK